MDTRARQAAAARNLAMDSVAPVWDGNETARELLKAGFRFQVSGAGHCPGILKTAHVEIICLSLLFSLTLCPSINLVIT